MAYLHSRQPAPGILHGDLKTSNLLLEDDGQRVVIADFGLAGWLQPLDGADAAHSSGLTVCIAPPEVGTNSLVHRAIGLISRWQRRLFGVHQTEILGTIGLVTVLFVFAMLGRMVVLLLHRITAQLAFRSGCILMQLSQPNMPCKDVA
jgi:serine/threonine protein kinase